MPIIKIKQSPMLRANIYSDTNLIATLNFSIETTEEQIITWAQQYYDTVDIRVELIHKPVIESEC